MTIKMKTRERRVRRMEGHMKRTTIPMMTAPTL